MKKTIIICVLVLLIPMGIISGGIYWFAKRDARLTKYKKIKGEIIELNTKKDMYNPAHETAYYPKIMYYDDNDEVHEFELKVGSNPPLGRVGEKIKLLVNPENPEDVVIDSFMYKWFGPMLVCIIGFIIFTFVSIVSVTVILNQHKQRKSEPLKKFLS